jgi:hypothetical protein
MRARLIQGQVEVELAAAANRSAGGHADPAWEDRDALALHVAQVAVVLPRDRFTFC